MVEALESGFDISWHRYMYLVFLVVPIYGDSGVNVSLPVTSYCVIFLEVRDEMFSVLFSDIFHAEVIDD